MRHIRTTGSLRSCGYAGRGIASLGLAAFALIHSALAQINDAPTLPEVPELPTTRVEAQIEFQQYLSEENYPAAVSLGERMLALTIQEYGTQSNETGQALFELGEAQRNARLFEDAEFSFLNAIEIFRGVDGQFSPMTIDPSIGLGDTYFDDGQYTNAVAAYNEARTTQRRTYGLLSEEQISVIDRMTRAFQSMEMNEEADEQQRNALQLIERVYGPANVETLEAMYKYGAWLRSVYRFDDERAQYERAVRIIRAEYGKEHLLLVRPYREIGNSFRVQGFESPRGASALSSALELLELQDNPAPRELAETNVDIGDWKTAFGPARGGHQEYLQAWNLLATTPEGIRARSDLLQPRRAVAVLAAPMSIRGLAMNPNDSAAVGGHVLLEFDINAYGRSENLRVLESDPPGFKDEAATRSIRQSRFRPRMENGEFVTASRQGYRISFWYVPDEKS